MEATEALLLLIPMEEKPSSIKGFRPISVCNVCVKVLSKMIVNHLKEVLNDIIAPNQASFIPCRQSIEHIVICQEVIHSLWYTKLRKGRNGVEIGSGESLRQVRVEVC